MLRIFSIKQFKIILLIILGINGEISFAQSLKGLYVDGFFNIIGNKQEENKLLIYAKENAFNYLILYNTTKIHRTKYALDNVIGSTIWKQFIHKAKSEYAINKIGVVGEKASSFLPASKYNNIVNNKPLDRIDVFNLEFEFWNKRLFRSGGYYCTTYLLKQGYDCTNEGAFDFYMTQLREMQKFKKNSPFLLVETYIGNPSDEQLVEIAKVTDRIFIHYYRDKTERLASYKLNRLFVLQKANSNLKIAPIFSSRDNHLGPWLKTHTINELPTIFFDQLKSISEIDIESLNFDGIIWYRYSSMPKAH